MSDDFALYETRYAENILGGGYPCFFCGINGPDYNTREYQGNLLCMECSARCDTKAGHQLMCPRIREWRSRRQGEQHWNRTGICTKCKEYGGYENLA